MGIANKVRDRLPLHLLRKQGQPEYKRLTSKRAQTTTQEINAAIDLTQFMGDRPHQGQASKSPKICHLIRMVLHSVEADSQFYRLWLPNNKDWKLDLPKETTVEQTQDYISFSLEQDEHTKRNVLSFKCRDGRLKATFNAYLKLHHANELYQATRQKHTQNLDQLAERITHLQSERGVTEELERVMAERENEVMNVDELRRLKASRERAEEALEDHLNGSNTSFQAKLQRSSLLSVPSQGNSNRHDFNDGYRSSSCETNAASYSHRSSYTTNATPSATPSASASATTTPTRERVPWLITAPATNGQNQWSRCGYENYDYVKFEDAHGSRRSFTDQESNGVSLKWGRILPPKHNGRYHQQPGCYELLLGENAKVKRNVPVSAITRITEDERNTIMLSLHAELAGDLETVRTGEIVESERYFKIHRYDLERLAFLGGRVDQFAVGRVVKFESVTIPVMRYSDYTEQWAWKPNCNRPGNDHVCNNQWHQRPLPWKHCEHNWKKYYSEVALELVKNGFPTNGNDGAGDFMPMDFTVVSGQLEQQGCRIWGQRWHYKLVVRVRLPEDEVKRLEKYQRDNRGIYYELFGNQYNCGMQEWQNGRIDKFQEIQKLAVKARARTAQPPKEYLAEWQHNNQPDLLAVLRNRDRPAHTLAPTTPASSRRSLQIHVQSPLPQTPRHTPHGIRAPHIVTQPANMLMVPQPYYSTPVGQHSPRSQSSFGTPVYSPSARFFAPIQMSQSDGAVQMHQVYNGTSPMPSPMGPSPIPSPRHSPTLSPMATLTVPATAPTHRRSPIPQSAHISMMQQPMFQPAPVTGPMIPAGFHQPAPVTPTGPTTMQLRSPGTSPLYSQGALVYLIANQVLIEHQIVDHAMWNSQTWVYNVVNVLEEKTPKTIFQSIPEHMFLEKPTTPARHWYNLAPAQTGVCDGGEQEGPDEIVVSDNEEEDGFDFKQDGVAASRVIHNEREEFKTDPYV